MDCVTRGQDSPCLRGVPIYIPVPKIFGALHLRRNKTLWANGQPDGVSKEVTISKSSVQVFLSNFAAVMIAKTLILLNGRIFLYSMENKEND